MSMCKDIDFKELSDDRIAYLGKHVMDNYETKITEVILHHYPFIYFDN